MKINKKLRQLYYNVKKAGSFSGFPKFYQLVKKEKIPVSASKVKEFLKSQATYTQYLPVRRRYPKAKIIPIAFFRQLDLDLADVSNLAAHNDRVKYLPIAIDIFSRYLLVEPLKSKTADSVIAGLKRIINRCPVTPSILSMDEEAALTGKKGQAFLDAYGLQLFHSYGKVKAPFAERVIRTLLGKITRFLHHKHSYRYIHRLADIVESYNASGHRSLKGLAPVEVTETNQREVWEKIYRAEQPAVPRKKRCRFKPGSYVRIARFTSAMDKLSRSKNYSTEIFRVKHCLPAHPNCLHYIESLSGTHIKGRFYSYELTAVAKPKKSEYHSVEKILKREKRAGKLYCLVKWTDLPRSEATWIPASNLKK